jgi:signal transduction histidine kinase
MRKFRFEHKITLLYIIIGSLWILFSDRLLLGHLNDAQAISRIQTFKGWFYVLITAVLFFIILRGYIVKLRKSQLKSEESDRLKTAFLQNVSHEIRTPMNAICGFSELLSRENLSTEKKKRYVDIIINNSNQLLSIVNDILTLSNIETGQESVTLHTVSIEKVARSIQVHFQPMADAKGIYLNLSFYKDIEILTDEEKLKQILWNLVGNAIKFTHAGGVDFGFKLHNNEMELFVKDTGIGIDEEGKTKIFKRFVQADPSISLRYGGTGLGLTISKSLTEMLGGKIRLESEPSKGTTVFFSLPTLIPTPQIEPEEVKSEKTSDVSTNGQTILVAEDEEYNYIYIEELLKEAGVNIVRAKNGQEAVDICTESSFINLVIMDIRMPIMNGFEATKLIKKLRPSLPIVAHSAYSSPKDEKNAQSAGFDEYLAKPLVKERLLEMLDRFKK